MKYSNSILKLLIIFIGLHFYLPVSAQSAEAVKYFDEGRAYLDKDEYDLAIISFTEAIKLYPNYTNAYNFRGYVYYYKKEYDIAISDHKEAIRIDPTYVNAHYNLASAYEAKKNFEMAISEHSVAIRLDSKYKISYLSLGNIYYQKKEYELAINNYNEMIRLDPKDPEAYKLRAGVYKAKKEYGKAIDEYTKILRFDSSNHQAYKLRADVYRTQKLYDPAIKDYTQAIRLSPKTQIYYYSRANAYKEKGKDSLAIEDFNEFVRIGAKASSYVARANFHSSMKRYELALNDFATAIKLDPKSDAYSGRGRLYRLTGQYELAFADFVKLLQIDPNNSSAFYGRAFVHKALGSYELAVKDFETALSLKPNLSIAYLYSIPPLLRNGQFDKAKEYAVNYYKNPLSFLDEDNYKFFKYYLAVIANDLPEKNYDRALSNLEKSLYDYSIYSKDDESNKSEYIDILALKGFVLEKLGRYKEAKETYEQALVIHSMQPDVKAALATIQKTTTVIAVSDKTPPIIQLISPQASRGLKIGSDNTEIVGKAKDPSGIASVTINGKPAKTEEDGLFILNVSLKDGANDLLITATDKKGNKASNTFTLTGNAVVKREEPEIIVPITADNKTPQYHAILIAAKDYADPAIVDLENPVKDAIELKNILVNNYTFKENNVETLYNSSREEIMQALVLKSNALSENDNLLIFYAGHGIGEKDKFGDVDGYWIPSSAKKGLNASYISSDDINKALKRSNAKHILVIADACFSGAFTRELPADASVGVQKQYSVPSRKIMASGNMEPVPDNSRFIFYLKKNLKENKEKYLTSKRLFDGFYEAILNNSDTSPQYAAIKNVGDEGGEFVFIKK